MATRLAACLLFVCAVLGAQSALAFTAEFGGVFALPNPMSCPEKDGAIAFAKQYTETDLKDKAALAKLVDKFRADNCSFGEKGSTVAIDAAPVFSGQLQPGGYIYVVLGVMELDKAWIILVNKAAITFAKPDKPYHWAATAFGSDADHAVIGGATDKPLASMAVDAAVADCAAQGVKNCRSMAIDNTACTFITYGKSRTGFVAGYANSADEALKACEKKGGVDCIKPKSYCSSTS